MLTHADIIVALGGPRAVAGILGRHETQPIRWRRVGIPPRHWPAIVGAARERAVEGVTFEVLARAVPDVRSDHGGHDNCENRSSARHETVSNANGIAQTGEAAS